MRWSLLVVVLCLAVPASARANERCVVISGGALHLPEDVFASLRLGHAVDIRHVEGFMAIVTQRLRVCSAVVAAVVLSQEDTLIGVTEPGRGGCKKSN